MDLINKEMVHTGQFSYINFLIEAALSFNAEFFEQ